MADYQWVGFILDQETGYCEDLCPCVMEKFPLPIQIDITIMVDSKCKPE